MFYITLLIRKCPWVFSRIWYDLEWLTYFVLFACIVLCKESERVVINVLSYLVDNITRIVVKIFHEKIACVWYNYNNNYYRCSWLNAYTEKDLSSTKVMQILKGSCKFMLILRRGWVRLMYDGCREWYSDSVFRRVCCGSKCEKKWGNGGVDIILFILLCSVIKNLKQLFMRTHYW